MNHFCECPRCPNQGEKTEECACPEELVSKELEDLKKYSADQAKDADSLNNLCAAWMKKAEELERENKSLAFRERRAREELDLGLEALRQPGMTWAPGEAPRPKMLALVWRNKVAEAEAEIERLRVAIEVLSGESMETQRRCVKAEKLLREFIDANDLFDEELPGPKFLADQKARSFLGLKHDVDPVHMRRMINEEDPS